MVSLDTEGRMKVGLSWGGGEEPSNMFFPGAIRELRGWEGGAVGYEGATALLGSMLLYG